MTAFETVHYVFAVGSDVGWPVEVWVLFASEAQARLHADAAAYAFTVFPLPVYDSYDDYPTPLKADASAWQAIARAVSDEKDFARLVADESPPASSGSVFAAGDFESTGLPEVRALYRAQVEAERHVAEAPGALSLRSLDVYASYDSCPSDQRFDRPGPALSQLVRPR
jgi:hypothetical protein